MALPAVIAFSGRRVAAQLSPRRRVRQVASELGRMKVAVVNLGAIVSGDWRSPLATGDAILINNGSITGIVGASDNAISDADVVIDADGMTAIPGLIDSHVHITFGDYTPRQRTVGYLES